jgi:hypothetical protein
MVWNRVKKPLGHTIWLKAVLTALMFAPEITQHSYDPINTTSVIASVLKHPFIVSIPALLPIAKLVLLLVVLSPIVSGKFSNKVLLGYYSLILIIVGIFQNMAVTDVYGFVWLIGNTCVQFAVSIYCLYDVYKNKSLIIRADINKKRIWVIIPMLIAFLMPYSVDINGIVRPTFNSSVLWNESGVTYCMITPVIIGMMLLYSKYISKPILSVVSYVGFIFGLMNMLTWFGMQSENWWMGVLHLPLLILSLYGLVVTKKEKQVVIAGR